MIWLHGTSTQHHHLNQVHQYYLLARQPHCVVPTRGGVPGGLLLPDGLVVGWWVGLVHQVGVATSIADTPGGIIEFDYRTPLAVLEDSQCVLVLPFGVVSRLVRLATVQCEHPIVNSVHICKSKNKRIPARSPLPEVSSPTLHSLRTTFCIVAALMCISSRFGWTTTWNNVTYCEKDWLWKMEQELPFGAGSLICFLPPLGAAVGREPIAGDHGIKDACIFNHRAEHEIASSCTRNRAESRSHSKPRTYARHGSESGSRREEILEKKTT